LVLTSRRLTARRSAAPNGADRQRRARSARHQDLTGNDSSALFGVSRSASLGGSDLGAECRDVSIAISDRELAETPGSIAWFFDDFYTASTV